jgi:hypothetical protein
MTWKEKIIHQENKIWNPEISISLTAGNVGDALFTEANCQQQSGFLLCCHSELLMYPFVMQKLSDAVMWSLYIQGTKHGMCHGLGQELLGSWWPLHDRMHGWNFVIILLTASVKMVKKKQDR